MHTHTLTHTCAGTRARTHTRAHTQAHTYTRAHTHRCVHARTHSCARPRTPTLTLTHGHTDTRRHTHSQARTHARMHERTLAPLQAHARISTPSRSMLGTCNAQCAACIVSPGAHTKVGMRASRCTMHTARRTWRPQRSARACSSCASAATRGCSPPPRLHRDRGSPLPASAPGLRTCGRICTGTGLRPPTSDCVRALTPSSP